MTKLKPTNIKDEVGDVLSNVHVDDNTQRGRSYITAYQILELLPADIRDRLIEERGVPGEGSGNNYAAASVVSDAAEMLDDIEIVFIDTSCLYFNLTYRGKTVLVRPSDSNVGLYRLQS